MQGKDEEPNVFTYNCFCILVYCCTRVGLGWCFMFSLLLQVVPLHLCLIVAGSSCKGFGLVLFRIKCTLFSKLLFFSSIHSNQLILFGWYSCIIIL
uniref:Putative ovule protein n=1 Tax=Solanum chacoense TaxID=4108 RepID=A0A0V0H6Q6_SOLCH